MTLNEYFQNVLYTVGGRASSMR